MHAPMNSTVQVVGSTCFKSVIGADRPLPPLARGDLLAVLDAGAYAEVFANQFNALPRPASVMISEHGVEIVRERESIADIFRLHRVPAWLSA
jgi:diaminopimelate decarboxylase